MAYEARTLDVLGARARALFRQYLPGTDAWLQQNVLYVAAKVVAMFWREYDLRLVWIYKQMFTRTATDIAVLRMKGADVGIYQKSAAPAAGRVTGTGVAGQSYAAGVRFLSGGVSYVSSASFTAAPDGSFSAAVVAEAKGSTTNRDAGAVLNLADPSLYPTLSASVTVTADGLGGGADIEEIESFRARILERQARPPQGGALPDYERFALEVPGVTKAWAVAFEGGIASIAIYFLFKDRPSGIPTGGDEAVVQAHIDAKRMVRVDDVVAQGPIAAPVAITIADLTVDSDDVRAAIAANLAAMFTTKARPGTAGSPFVLSRSWISEAISAAAGEDSHRLVLPAGDLTFTGGEYPVLGIISYA